MLPDVINCLTIGALMAIVVVLIQISCILHRFIRQLDGGDDGDEDELEPEAMPRSPSKIEDRISLN